MELYSELYNNIGKEKWDKFIKENSMGYAYHLWDMMQIERREDGTLPISFAILDKKTDEIVLCICLQVLVGHSKDNPSQEMSSMGSRWGLVVKDNLTPKQLRKVQEHFKQTIDGFIKELNIQSFFVTMAPNSEALGPDHCPLVNPLIFFGFAPLVRYTYIVDLSPSEEQLFKNCEQTTRQAIRKHLESGNYEIVEPELNDNWFDLYYNMCDITYKRTHGQTLSVNYLKNIFFNLMPEGLCKIYFLKNNELEKPYIANITVLTYKHTAYYFWGSSVDSRDIGDNKYILFESMLRIRRLNQEYIDNGGKFYFETGGACTFLRSGKEKGLNDFKKCFGTFLHPIYMGQYAITK